MTGMGCGAIKHSSCGSMGTADRAATEMMIIDNEQAKEGADGVHKQRQSRCHQLRVNNFLMKPREMFPDEA